MTSHEHIATAASNAAYSVSGSLILADALQLLNNYAAAFGVILGFMTFFVNWYYQRKTYQVIAVTGDRRKTTDD